MRMSRPHSHKSGPKLDASYLYSIYIFCLYQTRPSHLASCHVSNACFSLIKSLLTNKTMMDASKGPK